MNGGADVVEAIDALTVERVLSSALPSLMNDERNSHAMVVCRPMGWDGGIIGGTKLLYNRERPSFSKGHGLMVFPSLSATVLPQARDLGLAINARGRRWRQVCERLASFRCVSPRLSSPEASSSVDRAGSGSSPAECLVKSCGRTWTIWSMEDRVAFSRRWKGHVAAGMPCSAAATSCSRRTRAMMGDLAACRAY